MPPCRLDFGTSGVRSCLVDCRRMNNSSIDMNNPEAFIIRHEGQLLWRNEGLSADSPTSWLIALEQLITGIPDTLRSRIDRICVSGTSSSAVIYDCESAAVSSERGTRMYNFNIRDHDPVKADQVMKLILNRCPTDSATAATTSTLAKLLLWQLERPLRPLEVLIHQADYVSNALRVPGFSSLSASASAPIQPESLTSDWHNALKLGYDVHELQYPAWLLSLLREDLQMASCPLPAQVLQPGQVAGSLCPSVAARLNLPLSCAVVAGDSRCIQRTSKDRLVNSSFSRSTAQARRTASRRFLHLGRVNSARL